MSPRGRASFLLTGSVAAILTGLVLLTIVASQGDGLDDTSSGDLSVSIEAACAPDLRPDMQHDSFLELSEPYVGLPAIPIANPQLLTIPSLEVSTLILEVGVDSDGAVQIPKNVSTVGWVRTTAIPGSERGSAVIVGHRDGAGGEDGALYDLGILEPGAVIQVSDTLGGVRDFTVVSREVVPKKSFARRALDYFSTSGDPRLTIITCGGSYDRDNGGYQANVIVTAVPRSP